MMVLTMFCCLLSHLQSSSQYSNQQSQYRGHSHITWSLSTPPHTKDQPADIWLLLHSWKHVHCTGFHLVALNSSLDHFSTHCSFCVIVLCVQLPWQQKSPQDEVIFIQYFNIHGLYFIYVYDVIGYGRYFEQWFWSWTGIATGSHYRNWIASCMCPCRLFIRLLVFQREKKKTLRDGPHINNTDRKTSYDVADDIIRSTQYSIYMYSVLWVLMHSHMAAYSTHAT